jgi:hypothetical protein
MNSDHFKVVMMALLILSCTMLLVASLNIKTATPPPNVSIRRFWRDHFQADSVNPPNIQKGEMDIGIIDTHFENAFIKYEKQVIQGVNKSEVKRAQFHNMSIEGIPTLIFETEAETMEKGVFIVYQFYLPDPVEITSNTVMLIISEKGVFIVYQFYLPDPVEITSNTVMLIISETTGQADQAIIQLRGSDVNGTQKNAGILNLLKNDAYFVNLYNLREVELLEDFNTIHQINILYYCQPNSSMNVTTHIRVLNMFAGVPILEGEPIQWGQTQISLETVTFPHRVQWIYLKPANIFVISTLQQLNVTWHPSFPVMTYSWHFQNPPLIWGKETNAVIWINPFWDAPIVSAKITGQETEIDFLEDMQTLSNSSKYVRFTEPVPTESLETTISIVFDYWPSPWREIALSSLLMIIIEFLVFLRAKFIRTAST